MTPNATCKLLGFAKTASGTNNLARTWAETEEAALRCRMTQASVATVVSVAGEIGPQFYHCAVVTTSEPRPGWRAEIMLDGDAESFTYIVDDARRRFGHWHLLVRRV